MAGMRVPTKHCLSCTSQCNSRWQQADPRAACPRGLAHVLTWRPTCSPPPVHLRQRPAACLLASRHAVITPGTGFMARLGDHLREFLRQKLESDPDWAHLAVRAYSCLPPPLSSRRGGLPRPAGKVQASGPVWTSLEPAERLA